MAKRTDQPYTFTLCLISTTSALLTLEDWVDALLQTSIFPSRKRSATNSKTSHHNPLLPGSNKSYHYVLQLLLIQLTSCGA